MWRVKALTTSNVTRKGNKKLSTVDLWIIDRLRKAGSPVVLPSIVAEYATQRGISEPNARDILRRRLRRLEQEGIVERLDTYPISYKLKRLPLEFFAQISGSHQALDESFDLSQALGTRRNLVIRPVVSKKIDSSVNPTVIIQEFHRLGLRVIRRANSFRRKALLHAQYKHSIAPGSRPHADIAYLYEENIKWWNHSVIAFMNDFGQTKIIPVRTRFNDEKKVKWYFLKSKMALKTAFRRYRDALMVTLTVPHIFPLIVPLEHKKQIIGFIALQDSIISQLKNYLYDWSRKVWKDRKIAIFTAYEYHKDYVLHLHILIFGIPYLIDWSRKFGRKKEDALTYYSRKYGIELPPEAEKSQISKFIFTALLDKWLSEILVKFDSALGTNLLETYLEYKKKHNLQGPINEIHKIRDGKWDGQPPSDAFRSYSVGAAYQKAVDPDDYVTKYLTKIYSMLKGGGGGIDEENEGKIYGYWLFGKRFNSYSRSLLPQKKPPPKLPYWHFIGVFNILDLPEYIRQNLVS